MPATRSSTRLATNDDNKGALSRKRKEENTSVKKNAKKASKRNEDQAIMISVPQAQQEVQIASASDTEDTKLVPAVLTFDYEEAKKHLIQVDHRFENLFYKMKCKPFEQLEQVHPFR